MFRARLQLFRVFGIPINIDASWLLILLLLAWTLATLYSTAIPDLTAVSYWALGLATALAFFTCIVLHELGHALVARNLGMPIRGITLFLFGGVAEMEAEPSSPAREFAMAIAGPIVTIALAVLFWSLFALGKVCDCVPALVMFCFYLGWINSVILIFNLVPAFPLDGGRVLRSILWAAIGNLQRATHWASLSGQAFAWALIALGMLNFIAGNIFGGVWFGLIGLFLNNAAQSGYQQVVIQQVFRGEPVRRFMTPNPVVVSPWVNLRDWVDDYIYRYHHKCYPVVEHGKLEGVITTKQLEQVRREDWPEIAVATVMCRDLEQLSVAPESDAFEALQRMQRVDCSRLLVVDKGELVGILSLRDLLEFLDLKLQLEGAERSVPSSSAKQNEERGNSRFTRPCILPRGERVG